MNNNVDKLCDCTVIHEQSVDFVKKEMPQGDGLQRMAEHFKIFADTTRIKILWALSLSEMCVCDLAAVFSMSISAVSHQLKTLRLSNLVKYQRAGKVVYYSLADDHVKSILTQSYEHINE